MAQHDRDAVLMRTEGVFARMQFVTACFLAFAHGSNDVANAIGPAAAVISALTTQSVEDQAQIPTWLLLIGGVGIVAGLAAFGRKVIHTIGQQIANYSLARFCRRIWSGTHYSIGYDYGPALVYHPCARGSRDRGGIRPRY